MQSKHDFILGYSLAMQVHELAGNDLTKRIEVLKDIAAGNLTIVPTPSDTAQAMRESTLSPERKREVVASVASLSRTESDRKVVEGARLMLDVFNGDLAALD